MLSLHEPETNPVRAIHSATNTCFLDPRIFRPSGRLEVWKHAQARPRSQTVQETCPKTTSGQQEHDEDRGFMGVTMKVVS